MEQKIREIIARHLNLDVNNLDESAKLQDVVQDSMMLIGIVAELSDRLKLRIDPVKLNNVRTVGEAIEALSKMEHESGRPAY